MTLEERGVKQFVTCALGALLVPIRTRLPESVMLKQHSKSKPPSFRDLGRDLMEARAHMLHEVKECSNSTAHTRSVLFWHTKLEAFDIQLQLVDTAVSASGHGEHTNEGTTQHLGLPFATAMDVDEDEQTLLYNPAEQLGAIGSSASSSTDHHSTAAYDVPQTTKVNSTYVPVPVPEPTPLLMMPTPVASHTVPVAAPTEQVVQQVLDYIATQQKDVTLTQEAHEEEEESLTADIGAVVPDSVVGKCLFLSRVKSLTAQRSLKVCRRLVNKLKRFGKGTYSYQLALALLIKKVLRLSEFFHAFVIMVAGGRMATRIGNASYGCVLLFLEVLQSVTATYREDTGKQLLVPVQDREEEFFTGLQEKLDSILRDLGVPDPVASFYKLKPLFQGGRIKAASLPSEHNATEQKAMSESEEESEAEDDQMDDTQAKLQERLRKSRAALQKLLEKEDVVRTFNIRGRINQARRSIETLLAPRAHEEKLEVKHADDDARHELPISQLTASQVQRCEAETRKLQRDVALFIAQQKASDPFKKKIARVDRKLDMITENRCFGTAAQHKRAPHTEPSLQNMTSKQATSLRQLCEKLEKQQRKDVPQDDKTSKMEAILRMVREAEGWSKAASLFLQNEEEEISFAALQAQLALLSDSLTLASVRTREDVQRASAEFQTELTSFRRKLLRDSDSQHTPVSYHDLLNTFQEFDSEFKSFKERTEEAKSLLDLHAVLKDVNRHTEAIKVQLQGRFSGDTVLLQPLSLRLSDVVRMCLHNDASIVLGPQVDALEQHVERALRHEQATPNSADVAKCLEWTGKGSDQNIIQHLKPCITRLATTAKHVPVPNLFVDIRDCVPFQIGVGLLLMEGVAVSFSQLQERTTEIDIPQDSDIHPINHPSLQALRAKMDQSEQKAGDLQKELEDKERDLQDAQEEVTRLKRDLEYAYFGSQTKIRLMLSSTRSRQQRLQNSVTTLKQTAMIWRGKATKYGEELQAERRKARELAVGLRQQVWDSVVAQMRDLLVLRLSLVGVVCQTWGIDKIQTPLQARSDDQKSSAPVGTESETKYADEEETSRDERLLMDAIKLLVAENIDANKEGTLLKQSTDILKQGKDHMKALHDTLFQFPEVHKEHTVLHQVLVLAEVFVGACTAVHHAFQRMPSFARFLRSVTTPSLRALIPRLHQSVANLEDATQTVFTCVSEVKRVTNEDLLEVIGQTQRQWDEVTFSELPLNENGFRRNTWDSTVKQWVGTSLQTGIAMLLAKDPQSAIIQEAAEKVQAWTGADGDGESKSEVELDEELTNLRVIGPSIMESIKRFIVPEAGGSLKNPFYLLKELRAGVNQTSSRFLELSYITLVLQRRLRKCAELFLKDGFDPLCEEADICIELLETVLMWIREKGPLHRIVFDCTPNRVPQITKDMHLERVRELVSRFVLCASVHHPTMRQHVLLVQVAFKVFESEVMHLAIADVASKWHMRNKRRRPGLRSRHDDAHSVWTEEAKEDEAGDADGEGPTVRLELLRLSDVPMPDLRDFLLECVSANEQHVDELIKRHGDDYKLVVNFSHDLHQLVADVASAGFASPNMVLEVYERLQSQALHLLDEEPLSSFASGATSPLVQFLQVRQFRENLYGEAAHQHEMLANAALDRVKQISEKVQAATHLIDSCIDDWRDDIHHLIKRRCEGRDSVLLTQIKEFLSSFFKFLTNRKTKIEQEKERYEASVTRINDELQRYVDWVKSMHAQGKVPQEWEEVQQGMETANAHARSHSAVHPVPLGDLTCLFECTIQKVILTFDRGSLSEQDTENTTVKIKHGFVKSEKIKFGRNNNRTQKKCNIHEPRECSITVKIGDKEKTLSLDQLLHGAQQIRLNRSQRKQLRISLQVEEMVWQCVERGNEQKQESIKKPLRPLQETVRELKFLRKPKEAPEWRDKSPEEKEEELRRKAGTAEAKDKRYSESGQVITWLRNVKGIISKYAEGVSRCVDTLKREPTRLDCTNLKAARQELLRSLADLGGNRSHPKIIYTSEYSHTHERLLSTVQTRTMSQAVSNVERCMDSVSRAMATDVLRDVACVLQHRMHMQVLRIDTDRPELTQEDFKVVAKHDSCMPWQHEFDDRELAVSHMMEQIEPRKHAALKALKDSNTMCVLLAEAKIPERKDAERNNGNDDTITTATSHPKACLQNVDFSQHPRLPLHVYYDKRHGTLSTSVECVKQGFGHVCKDAHKTRHIDVVNATGHQLTLRLSDPRHVVGDTMPFIVHNRPRSEIRSGRTESIAISVRSTSLGAHKAMLALTMASEECEMSVDVELAVHVEEMVVRILEELIDFGAVLADRNTTVTREVKVRNPTAIPILVKAQMQMEGTVSVQVKGKDCHEMTIDKYDECVFVVTAKPAFQFNGDEHEALGDVVFFAGAVTNEYRLSVRLLSCKPQFRLTAPGLCAAKDAVVETYTKLQPVFLEAGQHETYMLHVKNTGKVPVCFKLDPVGEDSAVSMSPMQHEVAPTGETQVTIAFSGRRHAHSTNQDWQLRVSGYPTPVVFTVRAESGIREVSFVPPVFTLDLTSDNSIRRSKDPVTKKLLPLTQKIPVRCKGTIPCEVSFLSSRGISFDPPTVRVAPFGYAEEKCHVMATVQLHNLRMTEGALQYSVAGAAGAVVRTVPYTIHVKQPRMVVEPLGVVDVNNLRTGSTITETFTLKNNGGVPMRVHIEVPKKMSQGKDLYSPVVALVGDEAVDSLTVRPRKSEDVTLRITVPNDPAAVSQRVHITAENEYELFGGKLQQRCHTIIIDGSTSRNPTTPRVVVEKVPLLTHLASSSELLWAQPPGHSGFMFANRGVSHISSAWAWLCRQQQQLSDEDHQQVVFHATELWRRCACDPYGSDPLSVTLLRVLQAPGERMPVAEELQACVEKSKLPVALNDIGALIGQLREPLPSSKGVLECTVTLMERLATFLTQKQRTAYNIIVQMYRSAAKSVQRLGDDASPDDYGQHLARIPSHVEICCAALLPHVTTSHTDEFRHASQVLCSVLRSTFKKTATEERSCTELALHSFRTMIGHKTATLALLEPFLDALHGYLSRSQASDVPRTCIGAFTALRSVDAQMRRLGFVMMALRMSNHDRLWQCVPAAVLADAVFISVMRMVSENVVDVTQESASLLSKAVPNVKGITQLVDALMAQSRKYAGQEFVERVFTCAGLPIHMQLQALMHNCKPHKSNAHKRKLHKVILNAWEALVPTITDMAVHDTVQLMGERIVAWLEQYDQQPMETKQAEQAISTLAQAVISEDTLGQVTKCFQAVLGVKAYDPCDVLEKVSGLMQALAAAAAMPVPTVQLFKRSCKSVLTLLGGMKAKRDPDWFLKAACDVVSSVSDNSAWKEIPKARQRYAAQQARKEAFDIVRIVARSLAGQEGLDFYRKMNEGLRHVHSKQNDIRGKMKGLDALIKLTEGKNAGGLLEGLYNIASDRRHAVDDRELLAQLSNADLPLPTPLKGCITKLLALNAADSAFNVPESKHSTNESAAKTVKLLSAVLSVTEPAPCKALSSLVETLNCLVCLVELSNPFNALLASFTLVLDLLSLSQQTQPPFPTGNKRKPVPRLTSGPLGLGHVLFHGADAQEHFNEMIQPLILADLTVPVPRTVLDGEEKKGEEKSVHPAHGDLVTGPPTPRVLRPQRPLQRPGSSSGPQPRSPPVLSAPVKPLENERRERLQLQYKEQSESVRTQLAQVEEALQLRTLHKATLRQDTVPDDVFVEVVRTLWAAERQWCAVFHPLLLLTQDPHSQITAEEQTRFVCHGARLLALCQGMALRLQCVGPHVADAVRQSEIATLLRLIPVKDLPDNLYSTRHALLPKQGHDDDETPQDFDVPTLGELAMKTHAADHNENGQIDPALAAAYQSSAERKWEVSTEQKQADIDIEPHLDHEHEAELQIEATNIREDANGRGQEQVEFVDATFDLKDSFLRHFTEQEEQDEEKASVGRTHSGKQRSRRKSRPALSRKQQVRQEKLRKLGGGSNTRPASAVAPSSGAEMTFIAPEADEEELQRAMVNAGDFDVKSMLSKINTEEGLQKLKELLRNAPPSKHKDARDRVALLAKTIFKQPPKMDRWTYQRLAESKALSRIIRFVSSQLRREFIKLLHDTKTAFRFDFLTIVDNSGSMSLVEQYLAETLVVLMETLRKVECRFAVGRFGDEAVGSQKVLKGFDHAFDLARGEHILESFDFREGSYACAGFQHLSKAVWPTALTVEQGKTHRRIAIVITDGLSRDWHMHRFREAAADTQCQLSFLNLRHQKLRLDQNADKLMRKEYGELFADVDNMQQMSQKLGETLVTAVSRVLKTAAAHNAGQPAGQPSNELLQKDRTVQWDQLQVSHLDALANTMGALSLDSIATEKKGGVQGSDKRMYSSSGMGGAVPFKEYVTGPTRQYDSAYLSTALQELSKELHHVRMTDTHRTNAALASWRKAEERTTHQSTDVAAVLEDAFFPFNKWTRRRASIKGSTLHMPGLVKAVSTKWQYKKYMSQRTAGGKRAYSVVLAVDVSLSMSGHLRQSAQETLVCLIGALQRLGVEDFCVLLFGEKVHIVKGKEDEWDGPAMLMLLGNLLMERDEYATNDAAAIHVGLDLLEQGARDKKMFIITDGYGTSGMELSVAQMRAEEMNVQVVAIACGLDTFAVHETYKLWIKAAVPSLLASAFRDLFQPHESVARPEQDDGWKDLAPTLAGAQNESTQDIWSKHKPVFDGINQELRQEREATLMRGSGGGVFQVDIAIVMDVTSSMSPYIPTVKGHLIDIIKNIKQLVKDKYETLDLRLRFAVLPFRDVGDAPVPYLPFPEDTPCTGDSKQDEEWQLVHIQKVTRFIHDLECKGGGDIPEDVMGALYETSRMYPPEQRAPNERVLGWSRKSKAKFALLLCDAPGHGKELCPQDIRDDHPAGSQHRPADVMKAFKTNNIELLFCQLNEENTKKMEERFRVLLYKGETKQKLTSVPFFTTEYSTEADRAITKGFHYVLALDDSGSMSGRPWAALMQAVHTFCNSRLSEQGQQDKVSIVQYNSYARVSMSGVSVEEAVRQLGTIQYRGGGTVFTTAVQTCWEEMKRYPALIPVLVFMSDGCAEDPSATVALMRQELAPRGFVIHTVGFTRGAEATVLRAMAQAGGFPNNYRHADSGMDLEREFTAIAKDGKQLGERLVKAFGGAIAKHVADKLMLEFM